MKQTILGGLAGLVVRFPTTVLASLLALAGGALYLSLGLSIDSNQLNLLDQELPAIKELHRIEKMTGGTGFLMLAIRGDEKVQLKAVADDLAGQLEARDNIRKVTYKQEISFVLDNIPMYIETADLDEARKRIKKKIRAEKRKQNPFAIELTETKEVELNFDDLIEKYKSMGKKGIDDDYYISPERPQLNGVYAGRYMILLLIKPTHAATDLEPTRVMIDDIHKLIARYNDTNTHGAKLQEGYGAALPAEITTTYGFTGGYKLNLDDMETIRDSLIPTSVIALLGILVVLLVFLKRPSYIVILQVALFCGIFYTFGLAALFVGKLNAITTMLGCILQGLGIDYGIHLLYRLREEYVLTKDLNESVRMAIVHSGSACAATAFTTAAAFFVLVLSEFKGFSDFGKLAGLGVLIIAFSTYAIVPALFLVITKVFPRFPDTLLSGAKNAADIESLHDTKFPRPGLTLVVLLVITGALSGLAYDAFASDRWFDYNARSLMLPDQSSVILQEEIDRRFEISSDPVGVYCATFDDYRDLFNELHPLDREKYPTVDAPISFLSFLPPMEQQEANVAVLAKMKRDVRKIKRDMLDVDVRENYDRYLEYLEVKPFTADDLPDTYEVQFRAIESVRAEHPGWLTFIYPKVALWDGRDLLEFDRDVGVIQTETGKEFHSTGMAILFAKLAEIVLHDGQQLTLLTFALVFFLVLLNFRKLGATLIALTPLVGGIVWMIGFMGLLGLLRENGLTPAWLDIRLNFINMVVLTLIFGYGIDTGIHLYHRYVESGSVMRALRMTGGAVIASMVTALVGWGALIFAEHRGLRSMGMLACLGIASALIVSLTLVPALLQFIENVKGRPPEAATKETTP